MFDYELNLPVYKKGDDLSRILDQEKNEPKALEGLAADYLEAARVCNEVAKIMRENPKLKITCADTHTIALNGPKRLLEKLFNQGYLGKWETLDEK